MPPSVDELVIDKVLEKIAKAKRPVLHAGYGIRLSGDTMLLEELQIS